MPVDVDSGIVRSKLVAIDAMRLDSIASRDRLARQHVVALGLDL